MYLQNAWDEEEITGRWAALLDGSCKLRPTEALYSSSAEEEHISLQIVTEADMAVVAIVWESIGTNDRLSPEGSCSEWHVSIAKYGWSSWPAVPCNWDGVAAAERPVER